MPKTLLEFLQALFFVVSSAGGIFAVCIYCRDSNRRRAQWLMSLYEKFYEQPQYKNIRFLLDYRPPEYEELKTLVKSEKPDKRVEELVDYLNFFEVVASLEHRRQIPRRDVESLFQYYLDNIKEHDWLREYVRNEGFESLNDFLGKGQP